MNAEVAAFVARTTAASNVPEKLEDVAVVEQIAAILDAPNATTTAPITNRGRRPRQQRRTSSGAIFSETSTAPTWGTDEQSRGITKTRHDEGVRQGIGRYWKRYKSKPECDRDREIRELHELLDVVVDKLNDSSAS